MRCENALGDSANRLKMIGNVPFNKYSIIQKLEVSARCMNTMGGEFSSCAASKTLRLMSMNRIHSNNDPDGETWPTVKRWVELVNEASVKFGKEFNLGPLIKDYMLSVGFVDIHEKYVKIAIGPWPKGKKNKEMGVLQREHICDCVVGSHVAFQSVDSR